MEDKVLEHNEAIKYLKEEMKDIIDNYIDYGLGEEDVAEIIKETMQDIERIIDNEWEYVKIEENHMAFNNINVIGMREIK